VKQKLRTRRHLLATAVELLRAGRQPTVADVADAADVSRRTAYRYFPTQAKLLTESALEGLRPVMERAIAAGPAASDGTIESRVDRMVEAMQRLAADYEPLLRSMIHLTILEPPTGGVPRRGTRRVEWIEEALRPASRALPRAAFDRLVSALAVSAGIEAHVVLRDVRGLSADEAVAVSRWMARALLGAALAESPRRPRAG
jgi:AcrR family transcriptional regulator